MVQFLGVQKIFSGAFRAIKHCDSSATSGAIEWTGNFVAFMDNMLQMQLLHTDTRSLYVPTGIEKLVIDPQRHINHAKGENPTIPIYVTKEASCITSGGIQVVGLAASAITRRKQASDPVLEKHVFVANEETCLTTEESVRVNMQIVLENLGGTKVKIYEVVDEEAPEDVLAGITFDVLNDQPLIQPDISVLTKRPLEVSSVTVAEGYLPKEKDALVVIASNVLSRPMLLQQAFDAIKDNGFVLSREPKSFDSKNQSDVETITVHTTDKETLVLVRKRTKQSTPAVINVEDTTGFSWVQQLQKAIANNTPVIVYVQNQPTSGIMGMVNCLRREAYGKNLACVFIADEAPPFDVSSEFYRRQLRKGLAMNVFKGGKWGTYRHLLLETEPVVRKEHFYVNPVVRGDLSSLRWMEGSLTSDSVMEPEQTLVHVRIADDVGYPCTNSLFVGVLLFPQLQRRHDGFW